VANPTTDSAMYQTMHRQPEDVGRILNTGWEAAKEAAGRIADAKRVFLVGIGTSYHAAQIGEWLLRAAGCDARAVMSYDFAVYPDSYPVQPDDAVIIMAHTGVKHFSAEALKRATATDAAVISIGSQAAEHPGSQQVLRTIDREKSAAYTSSHTTAMTILAQIATELGEQRKASGTAGFRAALAALPDQMSDVLKREAEILPIAQEAVSRLVYATGPGPNAITASEAVIKVREAAYGQIDALPIEQFLHGPMVTVNAEDMAIMVHVAGNGAQRAAEVSRALNGLGTSLWVIGQPIEGLPDVPVFSLPATDEMISPLLAVVPMQILAYHMAVTKGVHPDTFRRDIPVYAEAFAHSKLLE
jgi:glucosamine--fructose-6-phosphate aminotransferase (isomerizing)